MQCLILRQHQKMSGLKVLHNLRYTDSLSVLGISNTIGSIAAARNEMKEARKWNDKALGYCAGIIRGILVLFT